MWLLKSLKKSGESVGLIKICFYTQYKTVLLDRLFLLDIFHIPLRCNRTEMREIIQCTSFVLINGTVTFVHFKTKLIISDRKAFLLMRIMFIELHISLCIVIFGQHCKLWDKKWERSRFFAFPLALWDNSGFNYNEEWPAAIRNGMSSLSISNEGGKCFQDVPIHEKIGFPMKFSKML